MAKNISTAGKPKLHLGDVFKILGVRPRPVPASWRSGDAKWEQQEAVVYRPLIGKKCVMLHHDAMPVQPLGFPWYRALDKETLERCQVQVLGTTRTSPDHWQLGRGLIALHGGKTIIRVQLNCWVAVGFVEEPGHQTPTFALTFAAGSLYDSGPERVKEKPAGAFTVGHVAIESGGKLLGRPRNSGLHILPRSAPHGSTVYFRCTHTDLGKQGRSGGFKRVRDGRLTHLCREMENGHILYDILEELLVQSSDPLEMF
jgi:hypothetical protein